MTVSVYLTFNGQCRKAFEFYRTVFGGEFLSIVTYDEMPSDVDLEVTDEDKLRIMHCSLPIKDDMIMGSDTVSAGPQVETGSNFSVYLDLDTVQEVDDKLALLTEGGRVTLPAHQTFWGSYFAMCQDSFGISWMLSCDDHG